MSNQEKMREDFVNIGMWPNEVMWDLWKKGWQASSAQATSEIEHWKNAACQAEKLRIDAARQFSEANASIVGLKEECTALRMGWNEAKSVAAREAEKLEPLRRQVAMLVGLIVEYQEAGVGNSTDFSLQFAAAKRAEASLANGIKATAETYEREVKAKVLEELLRRVRSSGLTIAGILDTMLSELRAANEKKEGE